MYYVTVCTMCCRRWSVETACTKPPLRCGWIAAFVGENSCVTILLFVNNKSCVQVPNLKTALFIAFVSYYCFNLEYPTLAKNVFFKTTY